MNLQHSSVSAGGLAVLSVQYLLNPAKYLSFLLDFEPRTEKQLQSLKLVLMPGIRCQQQQVSNSPNIEPVLVSVAEC